MNELALFAGVGGGILGAKLLGWKTVCAVEINVFCAQRLMQRQNEGHLSPFPIWDDVCTFDGYPWKGIVDVVSGGFPCQDISCAGKCAGIDGEKSGLWKQFARIICEVQPRFALVENSPMLSIRGLGRILGDLATIGYDAKWGVFSASSIGALHERKRMFILANANGERYSNGFQRRKTKIKSAYGIKSENEIWNFYQGKETFEPLLERGSYGLAHRVDRLQAVGNGQVPAVVKLAFETLIK